MKVNYSIQFLTDKLKPLIYGSKASNNANNPCSGATIRKCAVVHTDYVSLDEYSVYVEKTVKDANGNVIGIYDGVINSSDVNYRKVTPVFYKNSRSAFDQDEAE